MTTESSEPFVPALRKLMAEFRAPFVPDLPRFTGGAVGFIGYDASIRVRAGAGRRVVAAPRGVRHRRQRR